MQDFQVLYENYNQVIFRFLLRLTNYNADIADELTQETFFQVYISLPGYKGKSSIITWICSIAKNVSYKYYHKNPIVLQLDKLETQPNAVHAAEQGVQDVIEHKEILTFTLNGIMNLKPKYRDVLIYRLFFDMPFAEIAAVMKIKENSAKVIFHRGKEMVRKEVEGIYDE